MTVMNEPKTDTKEQMKTAIYCVAACAYFMGARGKFGIKVKAANDASRRAAA